MGGKGSGGKNRKSTAQKIAEGNRGKRELNKDEPKVPVGAPAMPDYLPLEAQAEWNRLVPMLLEMKVLTPNDAGALAGLCCAHAQFVKAQLDIAERGILLDIYVLAEIEGVPIVNKKGDPVAVLLNVKKNPSVQMASDADRRLRAWFGVFGLDPSSRSGIKAGGEEQPESALDKILKAKAKNANNDIVH